MNGRWRCALAVIASLVVPLVMYEGISWSAFMLAYLALGAAVSRYSLVVMTMSAALASLILGTGYWWLIRPHVLERRTGNRRQPPVMWLLLVPGAAVSCVVLNVLVALMNLDTSAYDQVSQVLFQPSVAMQITSTVVVIPLAEELVFRGFAYASLRNVMPFWAAALLSALYFGIFHGNVPQGIFAFLVGLELAFCYEWYGGLCGAYLFHGLVNLTSVAMMQVLN